MCEILFRAKSKVRGDWVEGCLVRRYNGYVGIDRPCPDLCFELIQVEPKTVCQYTGLIDKNGTRIFEGDIVRFNSNKANLIVNFSEFSWQLRLPNKKYYRYWLSDADNKRLEVVGNIFDNPELLEGEK